MRVDCKILGSATLAAALWLAGCAAPDLTQSQGKLSDVFATPDWARFANSKPTAARAVTSEDLIGADGRCVSVVEAAPATAVTDGHAGGPTEGTGETAAEPGALPALRGGVALQMTECQVVQRTGAPDRFDIGAQGNERVTTMTVTQGASPGLYRFRGGRLVSIERIDVPPPAKPAKAAKTSNKPASNKPAKKKTQAAGTPLRGAQD